MSEQIKCWEHGVANCPVESCQKECAGATPPGAVSVAAGDTDRKASNTLVTREDGSLALQSMNDQLAFAETLIKREMVSSSFKNASQVVIAFQYAKALKVPEMLAIRMMYVVNGRPCLFGDGPLSLCQRAGQVESIDEFFIDKLGARISFESKNLTEDVFGAVCRVKRIHDPIWQEDYFTKKDLQLAKMNIKDGKVKAVWEKYERLMMRFKARSISLKTKFADCIAGIPIAEHDFNFTPEVPEISGRATREGGGGVSQLTQRLEQTA